MRPRLLAPLLVLAAAAAAQDPRWLPSVERARAEASAKLKPLLAYSFDPWNSRFCGPLEDRPFDDPLFAELTREFVLVRAHCNDPAMRALGAPRACAMVMVFDIRGNRVVRVQDPRTMEHVLSILQRERAVARRERAALLSYALSFRPMDAALRGRLQALVERLVAPEPARRDRAAIELTRIGEPAYRVLSSLRPGEPELANRAASIREQLLPSRGMVMDRRLHRNVDWLAQWGEKGLARVSRILPAAANGAEPTGWWRRNRRRYRWDAVSDRYVAWQPWRSRPLRFRGRDFVRLERTRGALDLGRPFTIELWARWIDDHDERMVPLAGDEAWRGMHPGIRPEGTSGWVLRRHLWSGGHIVDFTAGQLPSRWFSVFGRPQRDTHEWVHIAVSRTRHLVRVFCNGEEISRRSCDGVEFRPSPTDLYLGLREHGWVDRGCEHDLRAFRISRVARYTEDFLPPQRLEADANTIVALDFRPGPSIRDRSGNGHHGRLAGPSWIGSERPGGFLLFEAESGRWSEEWYLQEHDEYSDGRLVEIWTARSPGPTGHWVDLGFDVEKAGRYRLYFAGNGLHRLREPRTISPFLWRVDGASMTLAAGRMDTVPGGPEGLGVLGIVDLAAGEHRFHLELADRREKPDQLWALWFDALLLEPLRD